MPGSVKVNADGTVTIGTKDGDVLVALDGENNVLIGGAGEDALIGGDGNDKLVGGGGNDDLDGNAGMDLLIGGQDDDLLNGGTGDDVLIGGSGFDTYLFEANSGADAIMGFNTAEDTIDLSAAGISSLDGIVTDDANGNAVIDLGDGNQVTVVGVSSAELLADGDFVLAPSGPEEIFLGIDDTYIDAGDNTDQIIDGDSNGEALTDTDLFVFGPGMGDDTITDFQHEFDDFSDGFPPTTIAGDTLDLTAYGITGQFLGSNKLVNAVGTFDRLVDITFLDANGNELTLNTVGVDQDAVTSILHLDDSATPDGVADSTLTLLGVDFNELAIVLEFNTVDSGGGTGGNA